MYHCSKYNKVNRGTVKWRKCMDKVEEQAKIEKDRPEKLFTSVNRIRHQGASEFCYAFAALEISEMVYKLAFDHPMVPELLEDSFVRNMFGYMNAGVDARSHDFINKDLNNVPWFFAEESDIEKGQKLNMRTTHEVKIESRIDNNRSTLKSKEYLKKMLLMYGPLAITFSINKKQFGLYSSKQKEVYRVSSTKFDGKHVMTCLGWETIDNVEVLKMKNSYGCGWGYQGHFYYPVDDLTSNDPMHRIHDITWIESISQDKCKESTKPQEVYFGKEGIIKDQLTELNELMSQ